MSDIATDVVIVGAGPAGISTALHLQRANPSWCSRITIVDRAIFPREKLCGGGITNIDFETRLGLPLDLVPTMHVEATLAKMNDGVAVLPARFRVVRRAELDDALVREAKKRGIVVRENVDVLDVQASDDGVELTTSDGKISARVLVAADGSKSTVRRKLKWPGESHLARLIEIITPEKEDAAPSEDDDDPTELDSAFLCQEKIASFDFTTTSEGVQGYYWDFPSYVGGKLHMNRGVYDSRVVPTAPLGHLKDVLANRLAERKREVPELHGHPIRWYRDDGIFSRPRVLLAGDAAGADALLGEGITFAFDYGELASQMIIEAFARNSFGFEDYAQRIKAHPHLGILARNYRLARAAYGSRDPSRALSRLAALITAKK